MQTLLVTGIESVVGANLAAVLSESFHVVGLTTSAFPLSISGCEIAYCRAHDLDSIRRHVRSIAPETIIDCGPSAYSGWQEDGRDESFATSVATARHWALAAREARCRLVTISSDAVFTGPWMFHEESSSCFCTSRPAQAIRAMEQEVFQLCPDVLLLRTNAYGWSPCGAGSQPVCSDASRNNGELSMHPGASEQGTSQVPGRIESILDALETGTAGPYDCFRYATPILATDLAKVLQRAFEENLHGLFHVAGAERTNPARFVEQVAEQFGLPDPQSPPLQSLSERPSGFGRGETSLGTKKIRKALAVAMPTIAEGLGRLYEQHTNGYRDQFQPAPAPLHDKVA